MKAKQVDVMALIGQLLPEGDQEPVVLTVGGAPAAVLMSVARWQQIQAQLARPRAGRVIDPNVETAPMPIMEGTPTPLPTPIPTPMPVPTPIPVVSANRVDMDDQSAAGVFMAKNPRSMRLFMEWILGKSGREGMLVRWGKRGPSIRAVRADDTQCTLLYIFPPGARGRQHPFMEVYLGNIQDDAYREHARARFMASAPFVQQGAYTLIMDLIPEHLDMAREAAQVLWDVARHITDQTTL